jgi:hypothetical protein
VLPWVNYAPQNRPIMHLSSLTLAVITVLLGATPLATVAGKDGIQQPGDAAPSVRAEKIDRAARPVIDGVLDEAVWNEAGLATNFTQLRPVPGEPASQRTEALIRYDDAAIYVAIRAFDDEPDQIVRQRARRGEFVVSDKLFVGFDSYGDGRTAFVFGVNASGVKYDLLISDDVREDPNWEAVWDVAVADLPEGGWAAEFRIPLSQLRFASSDVPQRWGVQFMREIARKQEQSFWAPVRPESGGNVSLFGSLLGMENVRPPRRVEVQPYVASLLTREPGDAANPFYSPNAVSATGGLDVRVGLSSTLTLSATINPDFGQVEADPAVVNLSAFESFLEERRPFFVEGTEVFQFGRSRASTAVFRPRYFYTRRIGRSPQRGLNSSEYAFVDSPSQTTIGGAAKVSGRVGPWSIGVLNALTLQEEARFIGHDGAEGRAAIEPVSNYTIARIRRDLRGGASTVGGLFTAAHRDLGEPALESLLASRAYTGGVDFEHAFAARSWAINGVLMGSYVAGSPDYIHRLQRAPQRYFQRPDAQHLALDPDRTSLAGALAELSIARIAGKLRGSATVNAISAGYEANDLGFQPRADGYGVSGIIQFEQIEPGADWLRRYAVNANSAMAFNGAGDVLHRGISGNVNGQLSNFWGGGLNVSAQPLPTTSDRLTRGGPLAERPAEISFNPWVYSDDRKPVTANLWTYVKTELGGEDTFERNIGLNVSARPTAFLRFSLSPTIGLNREADQFVVGRTDEAAVETFGRRYVFAHLEQRSVSLGIRANWTFTSNLSLQIYARPFISSGHYSRFKEFASPGTRQFEVYGEQRGSITETEAGYVIDPGDGGQVFSFGDPNFTYRSLRGNAVVRWEYRPGSTLFFVWQQQRTGIDASGDLDLGRDLSATFRDPVHNVFMVKLTYWLAP